MENLLLYSICTLIWGSTWLIITFQLDAASPLISVFYRFLLSAVILLIACRIMKVPLKYKAKQHLLFAAQGTFVFSVNYMLTYIAETMISSGLVALTFTLLVYYNIFGTRVFFKTPVRRNVLLGAFIGGLGIFLIFSKEIFHFDPNSTTLAGLLVGAVATLSASAGNLVSYKTHQNKVPVMASNGFGMLYGSLFTLLVSLVTQQSFHVDWSGKYIVSLLYLSLFGSVIAFGAYLSLVGRIGAEKASYTSVISPVIALTLSSLFEGFHWTPEIAIGVALCLAGNVLTLQKAKKRATS